MNKLKINAEKAKIQLSRASSADIEVELDDGTGRRLDFYYELQRADVQRLAEPLLARSVNLCRKALEEARLAPTDIDKLILVGGPTLAPSLREYLRDEDLGLGIELDISQDPLTVVARGAAIFAGTQRMLDHTGELPVLVFDRLCEDRGAMTDAVQADQLIAQGHAAIHNREVNQLRTINARLRQLLREPSTDVDPFSTIRKA